MMFKYIIAVITLSSIVSFADINCKSTSKSLESDQSVILSSNKMKICAATNLPTTLCISYPVVGCRFENTGKQIFGQCQWQATVTKIIVFEYNPSNISGLTNLSSHALGADQVQVINTNLECVVE